jgi:CARDB
MVAHAEMDPAMRRALVLGLLLVLLGGALAGGPGLATASAPITAASSTVTGNVSGPSVAATNTNATYYINGTGGPAYNSAGVETGNITWYASVTGTNTSSVTLIPSTSTIKNSTPSVLTVALGPLVQTLTLTVEIASTNASANATTNLTQLIQVVQPYTLTLHLHVGSAAGVASFNLTIALDGAPVGTVHIPALSAGENYTAEFLYPTLGLSSGEHTFTASLAQQHGLVTFAGGGTTISETFFVPGAPPSYTVWYAAGIAAFFGALFIFVTRVAARRRTPAKK